MIILDTNVVSEPIRLAGNPAVLTWLDRQDPESQSLLDGIDVRICH
ncbi:putative nucleic acid-binding protein [Mycoplana sp. BE70]|nr:hypothetical protein [Mycoplana sp. BE70]MDR6756001.1 putative nucleic acid-binding protein [Mycoplana sp. BE70]